MLAAKSITTLRMLSIIFSVSRRRLKQTKSPGTKHGDKKYGRSASNMYFLNEENVYYTTSIIQDPLNSIQFSIQFKNGNANHLAFSRAFHVVL